MHDSITQALNHRLFTAEQTRQLDAIAIHQEGISGYRLMQRAGKAAFKFLKKNWPEANAIVVVCGIGNNAGDGYVVARLAHEYGMQVHVLQLGKMSTQRPDAWAAYQAMQQIGIREKTYNVEILQRADIIVDAIFGTGIDREIHGEYAQAIMDINHANKSVLALDIPSGLHADTGRVLGVAIKADATISFIGLKQGMYTAQGPDHCGAMVLDDLSLPESVYASVVPLALKLNALSQVFRLGKRSKASHKGSHGHALVIAGFNAMAGAAQLCALAALRSGAGLVTVATGEKDASTMSAAQPELICRGINTVSTLSPLIQNASVIAIGPGLGQDSLAHALFDHVCTTDLPLIVDADALSLLAAKNVTRENWVLSPHPGEAARLLGIDTEQVQADRFSAAKKIQQKYGGVCVLKGAGTIIYGGEKFYVCERGNPGMAVAGMGDVLTGILAGIAAQVGEAFSLEKIACYAVLAHAIAGDLAAKSGERGMIATDLLPYIRQVVNDE